MINLFLAICSGGAWALVVAQAWQIARHKRRDSHHD